MTHEKILISDELRDLLIEIETQSVVSSLLLREEHLKSELVTNPVNYISISKDDKTKISYLTKDRVLTLTEDVYWTSSRRFQAKPGAFITKIFKDISAKEIEKFSNLYRSQVLKPEFNFEVVSGESIRKFYYYTSYASDRGSLGASCMKHDGCQRFLDIYVENKQVCSMLAMINQESGRLMGRALLWNFDSYKIMDRIYTSCDEDLSFYFKQWATKNGYIFKSEQNWYNTMFFEQVGGKKQELQLEIKLNTRFRQYPYVDTFKFIDVDGGSIYNYIPKDKDIRTLCSSDGSRYDCDYLMLDGFDRMFRHRGECNYLDYLEIYTSSNNVYWSDVNDQYILKKDSLYVEELNDYIFSTDYDHLNRKDAIDERKKMYEDRKRQDLERAEVRKKKLASVMLS